MFFNNEEVNENEEVIEFEEEEEFDIDVSKLRDLLNKKVEEKELTLDEILDKINTQGIYSLTDKEKKQLDNYANNIWKTKTQVFLLTKKKFNITSKTVLFADIVDENELPFASELAFENWYTSLRNSDLTDAQLRATPLQVTVTNQLDLSVITGYLLDIKNSCNDIDLNTDEVETKLDAIVTAIDAGGIVAITCTE